MEASGFWAIRPLLRLAGAGDQHPVLILPGFGADDSSTAPLRWTLRGQGYWVHAWRLGRNIGPTAHAVQGVRHRISALHREHGTTVTLIGQSLGGVFARLFARTAGGRSGDHAGQPVPDGGGRSQQRAAAGVEGAATPPRRRPGPVGPAGEDRPAWWSRRRRSTRAPTASRRGRPASTPCARPPRTTRFVAPTSAWRSTRRLLAVLDRLGRPEGDWRPFAAPAGLRAWYPRPVSWRDRRRPAA